MSTIEFNGQTKAAGKIVCIGKNYAAHIEEMDAVIPADMVVFMKPASAISPTLQSFRGEAIHYEGEICLLMGSDKVVGVGFGLDLTKRALQWQLKTTGLPWERAKAFDGAALFSPFVSAPHCLDELRIELRIDGELRQHGGCDLMLYPPTLILEELAKFTRLEDNDIIMTGTPAGVGEIPKGSTFDGRVYDGEQELISATWIAQ